MTNVNNTTLDQFKAKFALVFEQVIAWGDMDAFGHLNNVQYYRYIESARIAYMTKLQIFSFGINPVIVTNSCHYRASVDFPDTLYVGMTISQMGNSSMGMSYTLYSQAQQKVVATADAVIVLMNKALTDKVAIPNEVRDKILSLEQAAGHEVVQK